MLPITESENRSRCSRMPRPSRAKPRLVTRSLRVMPRSRCSSADSDSGSVTVASPEPVEGLSDTMSSCSQGLFHLSDGQVAEVEHTRGEHGVRTGLDGGWEVLQPAGTAARDERHLCNVTDRPNHFQ